VFSRDDVHVFDGAGDAVVHSLVDPSAAADDVTIEGEA